MRYTGFELPVGGINIWESVHSSLNALLFAVYLSLFRACHVEKKTLLQSLWLLSLVCISFQTPALLSRTSEIYLAKETYSIILLVKTYISHICSFATDKRLFEPQFTHQWVPVLKNGSSTPTSSSTALNLNTGTRILSGEHWVYDIAFHQLYFICLWVKLNQVKSLMVHYVGAICWCCRLLYCTYRKQYYPPSYLLMTNPTRFICFIN